MLHTKLEDGKSQVKHTVLPTSGDGTFYGNGKVEQFTIRTVVFEQCVYGPVR